VEECGPCPFFASFTSEFALQLRKKHGKTSVSVRKTSVRLRKTSEYKKTLSHLAVPPTVHKHKVIMDCPYYEFYTIFPVLI
jgi:hypothetical protein